MEIPRPSWIPEEAWELEGYSFDLDDKLDAVTRDRISRRANAYAIRVTRLALEEISAYEDWGAQQMLMEQWDDCRTAIRGVHHDGRELTPAERGEVADQMTFLSRDCICNEVVGLNQLGLKKK